MDMNIRQKTVLTLVLLSLIDGVIPIPILGIVLIYVVLTRPPWFKDLTSRIYTTS